MPSVVRRRAGSPRAAGRAGRLLLAEDAAAEETGGALSPSGQIRAPGEPLNVGRMDLMDSFAGRRVPRRHRRGSGPAAHRRMRGHAAGDPARRARTAFAGYLVPGARAGVRAAARLPPPGSAARAAGDVGGGRHAPGPPLHPAALRHRGHLHRTDLRGRGHGRVPHRRTDPPYGDPGRGGTHSGRGRHRVAARADRVPRHHPADRDGAAGRRVGAGPALRHAPPSGTRRWTGRCDRARTGRQRRAPP